MHRYAGENALSMDKLLAPDRPAEALAAGLAAGCRRTEEIALCVGYRLRGAVACLASD